MVNTEKRIKELHQVPCGALYVNAESVCRRGLRDSMDKLLDRLTKELHPVTLPDKTPRGFQASENGENLQGNSKLLQDLTGKLEPW
jgi:hypothetical protein